MASVPKLSSVITWILYFIPVYIFVLEPILRPLLPGRSETSGATNRENEIWGSEIPLEEWETEPAFLLEDESRISPEDGVPTNCPGEAPGYKLHLLSRTPLIIYIENFVSDEEADHLVDSSLNKYSPSIVYDGVTERVDPSKRLSDRALLDRDDTVRCLEDRARSFQGWHPHLHIERMWAQRYNTSGHYTYHYDWAGSLARGGDRISTFMVYLGADCVGGGTNFPRLRMPPGKQWCAFLECEEGKPVQEGITFKPIKGNAIFWENLRPDGTGYPETWHAAFPVTEGTKVGLNIWSWYQPPRRKSQKGT